MIRFRSVVSRIVALHLLAIAAAAICMPLALFVMLSSAAQELHQRALRDQAAEILRYLENGPDGTPRLALPPSLAAFYSEGYGRAAFAIIDGDGRVLVSSRPGNHPIAPKPPEHRPFQFFSLRQDGDPYYGVTVTTDFGGRPLFLQVAEDLAHRDVLIDDIVAEFFTQVGWITVPLLLLLLLIDVADLPARDASRSSPPRHWPRKSDPTAPSSDCPRPACRARCCRWSAPSTERSIGSTQGSAPSASSPPMRRTSCARRWRSCAPRST